MEEDVILDIPIPDFLNESSDTIHKRMIDNAPSYVNTIEGDFYWDTTRPNAEEHAYMTQIKLQNLLKLSFLQTTYGPYLDAKAKDDNIYRKSATKAYGTITITGEVGTIIPAGTMVSTVSDDLSESIVYETLSENIINDTGESEIDIEAVEAGSKGKALKNTITVLVTQINGIKSLTNKNDIRGGSDEEDDESLRARVFEKKQNPGTSGNIAHYKIWAKNVAGVGDAKVFERWDKNNGMNGNGTVKVVIVDYDKLSVSESLETEVFNYIETQRPAGAKVTVKSANELNVNIDARVVLARGYTIEEVKKSFEDNIKKYFKEIAFSDVYTYVSIAKVGNILLSTLGVLDYSSIAINSDTSNLNLEEEDIPVLGTVTLEV